MSTQQVVWFVISSAIFHSLGSQEASGKPWGTVTQKQPVKISAREFRQLWNAYHGPSVLEKNLCFNKIITGEALGHLPMGKPYGNIEMLQQFNREANILVLGVPTIMEDSHGPLSVSRNPDDPVQAGGQLAVMRRLSVPFGGLTEIWLGAAMGEGARLDLTRLAAPSASVASLFRETAVWRMLALLAHASGHWIDVVDLVYRDAVNEAIPNKLSPQEIGGFEGYKVVAHVNPLEVIGE